MTPQTSAALEQLRAVALALPQTMEKLSHGSPAFFIDKGRMFAAFWHDHHGDGITAALVKTSGPDEQAMLIELGGGLYYRPPYFGPSGWVGIHLDRPDTDWDRIAHRVAISWQHAAPPRLRAAIRG